MARFAGSQMPQIRQYDDPGLQSAGYSFGGEAAGNVSLGTLFGTIRDKSPDYTENAILAEKIRSQERNAVEDAKAGAMMMGIEAAKNAKIGELNLKAAKAQASATQKGGAMSALGGIASAAIGLFSDEDTKHTIDYIADATDTLRQLRPVTFFYKEEYSAHPERMHYGFIAQEFQEVMPDATYYDEAVGKLCIDTQELIALLVRANQQLENRVMRLEAKEALLAV